MNTIEIIWLVIGFVGGFLLVLILSNDTLSSFFSGIISMIFTGMILLQFSDNKLERRRE